jgi:hypothetical protein
VPNRNKRGKKRRGPGRLAEREHGQKEAKQKNKNKINKQGGEEDLGYRPQESGTTLSTPFNT